MLKDINIILGLTEIVTNFTLCFHFRILWAQTWRENEDMLKWTPNGEQTQSPIRK